MTREELREKVEAAMLDFRGGITTLLDDAHPADAVIRLVVEACAVRADECHGGFTSTGAVLRRTFLPKENPHG